MWENTFEIAGAQEGKEKERETGEIVC